MHEFTKKDLSGLTDELPDNYCRKALTKRKHQPTRKHAQKKTQLEFTQVMQFILPLHSISLLRVSLNNASKLPTSGTILWTQVL